MTNKEKVLKGLYAHGYRDCKSCPYWGAGENGSSSCTQLAREAYTLLKKQDTKTGYWITEEPNIYTKRTYCSVCNSSAPFIYVSDDYYGGRSHGETKKTKYCPDCGAKMNICADGEMKDSYD